MINFLSFYFGKAMPDENKPNHLCFKWGSNSGETANWHVPQSDLGARCCGSKQKPLLGYPVFVVFFLASEESLSLVFIHSFSVQF